MSGTNAHLWEALAAVLNALEAAGENPVPVTTRGFSTVNGAHGSVDADRAVGKWTAVMSPED